MKGKLDDSKLDGRVLLYTYETDATVERLCTRDAIRQESLRLLEQVTELRKEQDPVSTRLQKRKKKTLLLVHLTCGEGVP